MTRAQVEHGGFASKADAECMRAWFLTFNFLGGPPPVAPFPGCAPPAAADLELGCQTPPANCSMGAR